MILIDTSSWTQALRRRGDEDVRRRVRSHLTNGTAAWCDVVRVELWAGVRREPEQSQLRRLERVLPRLPINDDVWDLARNLATASRAAGFVIPNPDIIIAACARYHDVQVETVDKHFSLLSGLAV